MTDVEDKVGQGFLPGTRASGGRGHERRVSDLHGLDKGGGEENSLSALKSTQARRENKKERDN